MPKSLKITLCIIISLIIVISGTVVAFIFIGKDSPSKDTDNTKETATPTTTVVLDVPQYQSDIVNYDSKTPIVTLKVKHPENIDSASDIQIILYEDGFVSRNDIFANHVIHTTHTINSTDIDKVLSEIEKIKDEKSVTDKCSSYVYTIYSHKTDKTYTTCDVCSASIFDAFYNIQSLLTKPIEDTEQ